MALAVVPCHGCCQCCWQRGTCNFLQQRDRATYIVARTDTGKAISWGCRNAARTVRLPLLRYQDLSGQACALKADRVWEYPAHTCYERGA